MATLEQAKQLGIIDRIGLDVATEVAEADLVLIATRVRQMPEIMERIRAISGPQTVVSDGGSTKGDVVAAAREYFW